MLARARGSARKRDAHWNHNNTVILLETLLRLRGSGLAGADTKRSLDLSAACRGLPRTSILELKQAASRLSKRERTVLHAYLIRLRHNPPEWKRDAARRVRSMLSGRRSSAEELELRITRG
jgi:hypothetical protein